MTDQLPFADEALLARLRARLAGDGDFNVDLMTDGEVLWHFGATVRAAADGFVRELGAVDRSEPATITDQITDALDEQLGPVTPDDRLAALHWLCECYEAVSGLDALAELARYRAEVRRG